MKTPVYARDLKESLRTDAFMGKGFEKAFEEDEDFVIGYFDDSWKEESK